ncbi:hypothetical protein RvY_18462 [Ramazzottius varieornatus]|uniref:PB1 domain-containing protein n=1 Tax=Ramazzottius varieornatus TaxID=947166 RepID=A0A1D1W696_RAMVA|nr:hypothetical protein RvY_18462 [Ramazzottius varieornatus]
MAFQVKLFVDADQEIRRFNLDTAANYAALRQRVQELLGNDTFKMFWRDSDNDMVVLGSDDELQAARQSMKTNAPLRIFVRAVKKPTCSEKKAEEQADKKENVDSSSHAPTESSSTGTASVQRERADSVAESVKPDKEQEWTHLQAEPVADTTKVRRASLDKTTPSPTTGATNAAPTEADLKDQRIETALKAMAEMGFNNEGDLLRRLLNNYNGDLARVLDSIK